MSTETLIYIIIAGIIALFIALFQYKHPLKKRHTTLSTIFVGLRFITVFAILVLLINPKFEQKTFSIEKPNLVIATDNSSSIIHLKQEQQVINSVKKLVTHKGIQDKFDVFQYTFGEDLTVSDTLEFSETQTNIAAAFNKLSQVYKDDISPTILITDGNQTYGSDYQFAYNTYKQSIYPVILGDTVTYTDLKIRQLNVNKYAYLKNRFPVEAILVYNGTGAISSRFVVTQGKAVVYSKTLRFNESHNSEIINFTLPANHAGVMSYKAYLEPHKSEKNSVNNTRHFAVEVIDQKTKIAIVSDFIHPDLGALKKSIESNEQRTVSILGLNNIESQISDFDVFILNQPNYKFKKLFESLNLQKKNKWVIVGPKTDLHFINTTVKAYTHDILGQTEDYQPDFNLNFLPFIVEDIDFESFPPLQSNYGSVKFNISFESILTKKVGITSIDEPLLSTFEYDGRKEIVLFGEGIWKWRAQSFINNKSFTAFDDFIGKLIQYITSNRRKSRLTIDYESFYNGGNDITINAQYFDKNYVFDARETLVITVKDQISKKETNLPFIVKHNNYEVDLSNLSPSDYDFTVKTSSGNISKSGSFKILEYNVEQQFLNANVTKLQYIATNSKGKSYFADHVDTLINDLITDNRYTPVQKSHKKVIPLIDWKYLLAIIILALSVEWFLRKYNGLI